MSIARRIAELYEVKMNAVLDRAADPGEMVDYTYVQLPELLAEVRGGEAGIAASREQAQSRGAVCGSRGPAGRQAEQAVRAGRDARRGRRWRAAPRTWLRHAGYGWGEDPMRAEEQEDRRRRAAAAGEDRGVRHAGGSDQGRLHRGARPGRYRRGLRRDLRE